MNRRSRIAAVLSASLIAGSILLTPVAAQAATCAGSATSGTIGTTKTWIQAYAGTCYHTQGRVLRYVGSAPVTYLGPVGSSSYREAAGGFGAGQAYKLRGTSTAPWSAWIEVPFA